MRVTHLLSMTALLTSAALVTDHSQAADPRDMVSGVLEVESVKQLDDASVLISLHPASSTSRIKVDCIGATWGYAADKARATIAHNSQAHATAYHACRNIAFKHSMLSEPGAWGIPTSKTMTKLIRVPSDPKARYVALEKGGTGQFRSIVTQRSGSSGVTYSRRLYDCSNNTLRYQGTGDTPELMRTSPAESSMAPIHEASIAYYVGREACH